MDKNKAKNEFKANLAVTKTKSSLPPKIIEDNQEVELTPNLDTKIEVNIGPGDKQKHCIEILSSGFVQSYVDFFYLTHRPDPVSEIYNLNAEPREISVPAPELMDIRLLLTSAEEARRAGKI